MVLSPDDILYKNLGMQAEVNEIFMKEKLWRKKHITVLRWELTNMKMRMAMFPITLNM